MFGFLKKKLKDAIGSFTKKAEAEAEPAESETPLPEIIAEKTPLKEAVKPVPAHEAKAIRDAPAKKEKKNEEPKPKHPAKKIEQKSEQTLKKPKAEPVKEQKKEIKDELQEFKTEEHRKEEDAKEIELAAAEQKKKEEHKGFFSKIFGKKEDKHAGHELKEQAAEKPAEEKVEVRVEEKKQQHEQIVEVEEKPKGLFGHISESFTKVSLSEAKFDELFWDLEMSLLENNVAVEVIDKIKNDLRANLVDKKLPRNALDKKIAESLKHSVEGLFDAEEFDLIKKVKSKKPYVIVIVGINGSGKTTTVAKLINLFKKHNLDVVVAACDTFRAAAIQQLEEHTNKLGVKLIKHDYGSDPAAVAFDAIEHARAKNKDVVLIDTAGRLHSNTNLMAELEKVIRVSKPDLKIFIGESIAGNDVVEQVKLFNEKVGIDAIILAKADIDEKGGAAISVSYVTGKPILYLGVGQGYEDLAEFSKAKIIEQIGL